jgi:hypothetical protein
MKLRLQFNSIRLRLKRSEVEQFARAGRVEEKIISGNGAGETFRYVLEATDAVSAPRGSVTAFGMVVQVPVGDSLRWASSDQIGIEGSQAVGDQARLQILIEKDLACIDGTEEQNFDTFPHTLAGTKH